MNTFAREYVEALVQTTGLAACITDRDLVVAAAGSGSRELEGKEISRELDMVISGREGKMIDGKVGIIYRSFPEIWILTAEK